MPCRCQHDTNLPLHGESLQEIRHLYPSARWVARFMAPIRRHIGEHALYNVCPAFTCTVPQINLKMPQISLARLLFRCRNLYIVFYCICYFPSTETVGIASSAFPAANFAREPKPLLSTFFLYTTVASSKSRC
jgi:hypothetical protein